jgi:3-oxoadipate enol-lactonase
MPRIDVEGVAINYQDSGGDGPPLVFIHAFPLDSRMWADQTEAVRGPHRTISIDLMGFGSSDAPDDPSSYSMAAYAKQVTAVVDEAGARPATVCCVSMGGYVTFELLRQDASLVRALVLADTRAEADAPEGKQKRSGQQDQIRAEGTDGLIETLTGALLGQTTLETRPEVVSRVKELMGNPAPGFIGALEALKNRPDSTKDLATISVPTLVIVGEEDSITPPEASESIHRAVSGSELVVIPESGHLSNLETPAAFNDALVKFLSSL